jgi:hypothetical protein
MAGIDPATGEAADGIDAQTEQAPILTTGALAPACPAFVNESQRQRRSSTAIGTARHGRLPQQAMLAAAPAAERAPTGAPPGCPSGRRGAATNRPLDARFWFDPADRSADLGSRCSSRGPGRSPTGRPLCDQTIHDVDAVAAGPRDWCRTRPVTLASPATISIVSSEPSG